MRADIQIRGRRRGSTLILFTLMLTSLLLPMVGLAIDGTLLYIVQAKLSAAVDGAALGAGRLLGSSANTEEIAGEFVRANFPAGYWGSYNLVPDIHATTSFSTHTITISATADVPLLFMRIFRYDHSRVRADAVATRRDTRIELVLDRSYSMRNNIGSLRSSAASFVGMFTPGADELGLIVFGGSGFVAYPTTVHLSSTGPNGHYADAVSGGADNMVTMINNMQVGSDTNSSEGLWLAYQELLRANSIDNDPTRLNAIVFFTDGVPNGFTAFFNDPSNGGVNNALSGASGCTYNPATSSNTNMYGFMCSRSGNSGLAYFNPNGTSHGFGTFKMLLFDVSHDAHYWDVTTSNNSGAIYVNDETQISGTPYTGCVPLGVSHLAPTNNNNYDYSGLRKIPPFDYYGNSTTGAAVPDSEIYKLYHVAYNSNQPSNGYHVGLASWNAVDNAARRILADTNMKVWIFCIGYTGNGGIDTTLLNRIANTQISTGYNVAWNTGKYVSAGDSVALAAAFNTVASSILRLAQ